MTQSTSASTATDFWKTLKRMLRKGHEQHRVLLKTHKLNLPGEFVVIVKQYWRRVRSILRERHNSRFEYSIILLAAKTIETQIAIDNSGVASQSRTRAIQESLDSYVRFLDACLTYILSMPEHRPSQAATCILQGPLEYVSTKCHVCSPDFRAFVRGHLVPSLKEWMQKQYAEEVVCLLASILLGKEVTRIQKRAGEQHALLDEMRRVFYTFYANGYVVCVPEMSKHSI